MKKIIDAKSFVFGVVIAVLLMGATTFALASTGTIDVVFDGIKVYVQKGQSDPVFVDKPNIIYNDTTYVPLRTISEMFGYNVDYNDETKSAVISDQPKPKQNKAVLNAQGNPFEIVNVSNTNFKRYQNLDFMLINKKFTTGLFGLEVSYGYNDNEEPQFYFVNKMPKEIGSISNISMLAINTTKNKSITAMTDNSVIPIDGSATASVTGIDNVNDVITDNIYVTQVKMHVNLKDNDITVGAFVTYDFLNETYTLTTDVTGYSETNLLTYKNVK